MSNLVQKSSLFQFPRGAYGEILSKLGQNAITQLSNGLTINYNGIPWKVREFSTQKFTVIIAFNQTQFEGFISRPPQSVCEKFIGKNISLINGEDKTSVELLTFVIEILITGTICVDETIKLEEKTSEIATLWLSKHKLNAEKMLSPITLNKSRISFSNFKTYFNFKTFFKIIALLAGVYAAYRLTQGRFFNPLTAI